MKYIFNIVTRISLLCFYFFSNLLGIQKHFCLIKVNDGSKDYSPESKTIIDIPTLAAFFGKLDTTKGIVGEYVRGICENWNKKYLDKPQVGYFFVFLHLLIFE